MNMKPIEADRALAAKDDVKRMFPVLFMFLSFGNMVLCLGLISFVPHAAAYGCCALMYAALICTERRFSILSPVSISMFFLYIALVVLDLVTQRYVGYAGVFVFAWLSLLNIGLLICKRPFTAFYSSGRGMRQLHYAVSSLWTATYLLCFIASVALMPNLAFLILPYVLCIGCGLLTIFLNLVWFGRSNGMQQRFTVGQFVFRRVVAGSEEFVQFCQFYARQIYRPGDDGNVKTVEQIAENVAAVELALAGDSHIFVAVHGTQIVGCIRCVIDRKQRPFPLEQDMQLSFDPLRKIGRVLYVGRLAVDTGYRERPDVLNGLFKCFVDLALSRDISFVVAEGFPHRLPTYLKLGFEILFARSDPRHAILMSHGYICHPVYLNFAQLIFNRGEAISGKYSFSEFISRYLVERWYKRNALRQLLRMTRHRPWHFDLQQIRTIL
jgi:hypothetical protein